MVLFVHFVAFELFPTDERFGSAGRHVGTWDQKWGDHLGVFKCTLNLLQNDSWVGAIRCDSLPAVCKEYSQSSPWQLVAKLPAVREIGAQRFMYLLNKRGFERSKVWFGDL